jgi:hypothetical protein
LLQKISNLIWEPSAGLNEDASLTSLTFLSLTGDQLPQAPSVGIYFAAPLCIDSFRSLISSLKLWKSVPLEVGREKKKSKRVM